MENNERNDSAPSKSLASQATPIVASLPTDINWNDVPTASIGRMVAVLAQDIDNPDRVWENFDLCTGLLESKHGPVTYKIVAEIKDRLSLAWAAKHDVRFGSDEAYALEGDEGFKALYRAYDLLNAAEISSKFKATYRIDKKTYETTNAKAREISQSVRTTLNQKSQLSHRASWS